MIMRAHPGRFSRAKLSTSRSEVSTSAPPSEPRPIQQPSDPLQSRAMLRRLHRSFERFRFVVLAVVLGITGFFGYQTTSLRFDNSLNIWFLDDDPDLLAYRDFLDRFETDESIILLLEPTELLAPEALDEDNRTSTRAGAVFAPEFLAALDRFSARAAAVESVIQVHSLTSVDAVRGEGHTVHVGRLIPELPETEIEARAVRELVMADSLYRGSLVTEDETGTAVVVEIEHHEDDFTYKSVAIAALREIAEEEFGDVPYKMSGAPVIDDAFFHYSERDARTFLPAMVVVLIVMLGWLFRSGWGVLLPCGLVTIAAVWTHGIMAMLGWPFTVVATILTPLVMAVGVAASVHVLSEVRRLRSEGMDFVSAREHAFEILFAPCLTTSLTTAAGMLSLSVASLAPIRQFGALAAVGAILAFIITFTALPAALAMLPERALLTQRQGSEERFLSLVAKLASRHAGIVLGLAGIVVVMSIIGITQLRVGQSMLTYFRPGDPVMEDLKAVDEALGGTGTVEVIITASEDRRFFDPELLGALDELGTYLEQLPTTGRAFSVVDALVAENEAYSGRAEVPDSIPAAAQLMSLLEGSDLFDRYLSGDYRIARLSANIQLSRFDSTLIDLDEIQKTTHEIFDGLGDAHVTGYLKLMSNMESYLIDSQIRSFLLAFSLVLLLITALFRSIRMGLFSMIPNLPPILLTLGIMGWFDIALDTGTVMIAGVLLGLVVDDTIHFLAHFRRRLRAGDSQPEAVDHTQRAAGRAITITSLVLAASFATTLLGSFSPNINFGFLSAIAVLAALIFDLVVLPATIAVIKPKL